MAYRIVPRKKRRKQMEKDTQPYPETQARENYLDYPSGETKFLFALPFRVRERLQEISSPTEHRKAEALFFEDEMPSGVYLLESGRVKLSAGSADGRSLLVRIAEPGEIIGLAAVISGKTSEVTAEALGPARCNFIAMEEFLQFLEKDSEGALCIAEILARIYQATLNQVRCLGFSASAAEKLARFLLDLSHASWQNNQSEPAPVSLTHGEIAAMIGTSRETVTRTVARFKREQLVMMKGSDLYILNRTRLQQMAAG